MRVAMVLLVASLLTVGLAGCLAPETPSPANEPPSEDPSDRPRNLTGAYTLVWVHGEQRTEPPPDRSAAGMCAPRSVTVDPDEAILRYEQERYPFDPANLTRAVAYTRVGWCELGDLVTNEAEASHPVGAYGWVNVTYQEDGSVLVHEGTVLAPGENATFPFSVQETHEGNTSWTNGTIRVDHLGQWPLSGLRPAS